MAASPQIKDWSPPPLSALRQDQLPVHIYQKFKNELGEVNSHLCILDAAIQELALAHRQSADGVLFLKKHTRAHGHRNLATDKLNLKFALKLAYTSNIALLLSRLEQLCKVIRRHKLINIQLNELMKGDFLRRTLWLVVESRKGEKLPTPIQDVIAFDYLDSLDLAIFDYYRTMRNLELHAASETKSDSMPETDDNLIGVYSKIDLQRSQSEFGHAPAQNGEMSFRDVLLVSKSCQRIARCLCRSIADPQRDILPELRRRFGSHTAERRRNAAKALMSQSYLLDFADVERVLYDLAW